MNTSKKKKKHIGFFNRSDLDKIPDVEQKHSTIPETSESLANKVSDTFVKPHKENAIVSSKPLVKSESNEDKVFEVLTSHGVTNIRKIADITGIERQGVMKILYNLNQKGMIALNRK